VAAFMADAQVPWGVEALSGAISEPAWKSKPSWYLVSTEDRMIPPPAQRLMAKRAGATVVEASGSHSIYVSQPAAVIELIIKAAQGSRAMAHIRIGLLSPPWPRCSKPRRQRIGDGVFLGTAVIRDWAAKKQSALR
jgi:hypothetical protein